MNTEFKRLQPGDRINVGPYVPPHRGSRTTARQSSGRICAAGLGTAKLAPAATAVLKEPAWVLDSGAEAHLTYD